MAAVSATVAVAMPHGRPACDDLPASRASSSARMEDGPPRSAAAGAKGPGQRHDTRLRATRSNTASCCWPPRWGELAGDERGRPHEGEKKHWATTNIFHRDTLSAYRKLAPPGRWPRSPPIPRPFQAGFWRIVYRQKTGVRTPGKPPFYTFVQYTSLIGKRGKTP